MAEAGTLVNTSQNYVNAGTGATTAFSGINDLTPGMKTFYETVMLDNSRSNRVFAQLGKRQPLPSHKGKVVEWRKWNILPDADVLVEGVIPTGKMFGQTLINVTLTQMGLYVAVTDVLENHHVDPVYLGATEEVGASIGRTEEKLIRAALQLGTNTLYADQLNTAAAGYPFVAVNTARHLLSNAAGTFALMAPDTVAQGVTMLQQADAPFYDGAEYVMAIHPSVWYDLRRNPEWIDVHKYSATTEIFNGEVGTLHGVRFLKSTLCPILRGADLLTAARTMTVDNYNSTGNIITVDEAIPAADAALLVGREVIIGGEHMTIVTVTAHDTPGSASFTVSNADETAWGSNPPADGDVVYPGEGGAGGIAVYQSFLVAKDAFAIIDPDGAGKETIIHDKNSGIGGALNQFGTVGGKFSSAAKILYEDRIVVIESTSKYSATDVAN